jgi:hypothetical protein
MENLRKFENWVSTSSDGTDFNMNGDDDKMRFQYVPTEKGKAKDKKKYFGIHEVILSRGEHKTTVRAKFDTGANSSSIDFSVAKKLGISKDLIKRCKYLEKLNIPKNISFFQQGQLERRIYFATRREFPEVRAIKLVKSSSGFSIRMFINITIQYDNRTITSDVNLRDRTGMACLMLVGLKDML